MIKSDDDQPILITDGQKEFLLWSARNIAVYHEYMDMMIILCDQVSVVHMFSSLKKGGVKHLPACRQWTESVPHNQVCDMQSCSTADINWNFITANVQLIVRFNVEAGCLWRDEKILYVKGDVQS